MAARNSGATSALAAASYAGGSILANNSILSAGICRMGGGDAFAVLPKPASRCDSLASHANTPTAMPNTIAVKV
jgi:hypothetical protein